MDNKGRNRKRRARELRLKAVLMAVILIVLLILGVSLASMNGAVRRLRAENESLRLVSSEAEQEKREKTGNPPGDENLGDENPEDENPGDEPPGDENPEDESRGDENPEDKSLGDNPRGDERQGQEAHGSESGGASEEGRETESGAETGQGAEASSAAAETMPEKLQTLDGVAAGTIVGESELEMDHLEKYFQAYEIKTTGAVYKRIQGKSYRENSNVALGDLRYLKVLHYNFDHELQVGEMIVNKALARDMLDIFREFYDAEYEIQSMHLVDNYWTGDGETSDSASIDKNNTSAFNYRPATGGKKLSNHAYGFAIDLNPQQNPYVSFRNGKPRWFHENANDYIDRNNGLAHVITHEDLAYKLFSERGFTWGGDWNNPKDYQHFEKKPH